MRERSKSGGTSWRSTWLGIFVAAYIALALRFDRLRGPFFVPAFPVVVGLLLAVRTIVNIQLGLYSRRWRFASVPDLERIVAAVALGSLGIAGLFYGRVLVADTSWPDGFPRSFWLAEALLSIAILGGVRFGIRAAPEPGARPERRGLSAMARDAPVRCRPHGRTAGAVGPAGSARGRRAGRVP